MIKPQRPLDLLRPPSGRCLGAVFSTYAFDESFFESVLGALLPIHADPESDTRMFLAEARRRLRETPVVVLADGASYSGGHRLPFHLVLSPLDVALQSRWALLLFANHARLIIGSANLTSAGFGESADLCAMLELTYDKDAGQIAGALDIFERQGASGEGWERFRRQAEALLGQVTAPTTFPRLIATTAEASVLKQFLASFPKSASVEAVHLMVPTQPEDDARSGEQTAATLKAWLKKRARSAELNLAVTWSDASIAPPAASERREPEQVVDRLCAEVEGPPGAETVRWAPADAFKDGKLVLRGRSPLPRKAVASVMQADPARFWAVEEVTGSCLMDGLGPLSEAFDVDWWLFPETQRRAGQVRKRPFHARLLAVCTKEKEGRFTHLLLGAPNFARATGKGEQLLEVALHLKLEGCLKITDICPELVPAPSEGFYLVDSAWLPVAPREQAPLERATFDARTRQLTLDWQARAPDAFVHYQRDLGEDELFRGRPALRTILSDFILVPSATEVRVTWGEKRALVPITLKNLSYLRADEPEEELQLKELVSLVSGQGWPKDELLHAQDVFHAQQCIVDDLSATGQLLGAFEVSMDGPLGLRAYADRLMRAEGCDPAEAWLYGLELCRLLRGVDWRKDPLGAQKREAMKAFVKALEERLTGLVPQKPWSVDVAKFYRERP